MLLITNQPTAHNQPGYVDALRRLTSGGEIEGFDVVAAISDPAEGPTARARRVARAIDGSTADVVLCLSLKRLVPLSTEVAAAVSGRRIVYWEGDAWGRRKSLPDVTAEWLKHSEVVFTVAGPPQAQMLIQLGAREVRQTVHTYDQILFGRQPPNASPVAHVVFVGNNLARIPGLSGLPGSAARRHLVARLRRRFGAGLRVAGEGWPARYRAHPIAYQAIGSFIESGRILASWEHFPNHGSYASDRLAVGMVTGRPQVTSRPNGQWWVPEGIGVITAATWREASERIDELAALPAEQTYEMGIEARRWSLDRLSHVQAVRHMLHTLVPSVDAPPADPWSSLPGPWVTA
ncbi:MAG: hypothetical protein KDB83_06835 [Actinobacteria bacterium]|nr:hypothetical protein [Actinomycetota bacterium]